MAPPTPRFVWHHRRAQPDDPIAHMVKYLTTTYPSSAAGVSALPSSATALVDDDEADPDEASDDDDDYIDDEIMLAQTKKCGQGRGAPRARAGAPRPRSSLALF